MRFFVTNKATRQKVYIALVANTRDDVRRQFPSGWFSVHNYDYHVSEVVAEPDVYNVPPRAVIGGLIGILAGPVGMVVGAGMGGATGYNKNNQEKRLANLFNHSI